MLDGIPIRRGHSSGISWRDRIQTGLRGSLVTLAQSLTSGAGAARLHFDLIKAARRSVSVRLLIDNKGFFLKLFDGPHAERHYEAERNLLLMLRDEEVVPTLLAFSDTHHFVITEWNSDPFENHHLDAWGSAGLGDRLGDWLARYDAAAPFEPGEGTWADYVLETPMARFLNKIPGAYDCFASVPICGMGLSYNDAALHNFLVEAGDELLRADFERAAFRPRGWDYISAQHAVMQRFPEECGDILPAMSGAFAAAHKGALRVDELDRVGMYLFCLLALTGRQLQEEDSDGN